MSTLPHVRWIGGAPAAGKSTVARRLAHDHRAELYATDDVMADHARRTTATASPQLAAFLTMTADERWLTRDPHTMLETFHWFRGEAFDLIVDDLRPPRPVIAEGFRLLPHLVAPLLADPRHAVWLIPAPGFYETVLTGRGHPLAARTSDPPRARANLRERDLAFAARTRAEATALGLTVIDVDDTTTEDETARVIARRFHGVS